MTDVKYIAKNVALSFFAAVLGVAAVAEQTESAGIILTMALAAGWSGVRDLKAAITLARETKK